MYQHVSFLFKTEWYSVVWICHFLFIYSSFNRHLVCIHVLTIVSDAAIHMSLQIPNQVLGFSSFKYLLRIPQSYSNSDFNFLRSHHTVFHALLFYIPISSAQGFQFLYILAYFFLCYPALKWVFTKRKRKLINLQEQIEWERNNRWIADEPCQQIGGWWKMNRWLGDLGFSFCVVLYPCLIQKSKPACAKRVSIKAEKLVASQTLKVWLVDWSWKLEVWLKM